MDLLAPINTLEDFRERNREARLELKQLIASGDAFAMIGAGSSKRVGFPLWDEFLVQVYNSFEEENKTAIQSAFLARISKNENGNGAFDPSFKINDFARGQPLILASVLEHEAGKLGGHSFRNELEREFRRAVVPEAAHERLLSLPFRGVLTTNYDYLLETTLEKLYGKIDCDGLQSRSIELDSRRNCLYRFLQPTARGLMDARLILHLHGVAEIPQNCIITDEDYARAYPPTLATEIGARNQSGFHYYFLNSLVGMHRIVFFGFSYSDPFIRRVIRQCSTNLWLDGRPMHYLVDGFCPETESDKMRFAKELIRYGVQLVCFDQPANTYRAFPDAIEFLAQDKVPEVGPVTYPAPTPINRMLIETFAKKDEKFLDD